MKTLDEVIKANECCDHGEPDSICEDCPYNGIGACCAEREADALHYLKDMKNLQEDYDILYDKYWREFNQQQENPALTWDELKQMEGKPVWVETKDEGNFWCVIDHYDQLDNHINHGEEFMLVDGGGWYYLEDMGTDWQAYRKERTDD